MAGRRLPLGLRLCRRSGIRRIKVRRFGYLSCLKVRCMTTSTLVNEKKGLRITLWILQGLLALLFVFAGGMKFVMSVEEMTKQMPGMSGTFLHFIGVAEMLGGLGLVLPGLLRIQPGLTP